MLRYRCALLAWLACVCAGAAALPAATQAPLVVTTADGDSSSSMAPTSEAPTTPGPPPPLKLTAMDVTSEVAMRYARTAVVTYVRNPANRPQEAVFRVLIPETAFISGFEMTLDNVTYKAYVKGKEEAKQIYDQAVSQGISAGHVAVKARDSNQFVVTVNVEANSAVRFNLTYEELLVRRNGVYNHDINLNPGALVPQLTVRVRVREPAPLTALRVPEVRTGNEIDATDTDPSNAVAVIERSADNREATITFKPDLEEQKRLMQVYEEKTKESQQSSRRYYSGPSKQEGVLGQFVVQYDVERSENGDILVNDGYFVHFFAPKNLPPLKKLVVFVLDTSGSMMDRKIVQLREAMQTILGDLNPGDYFSIVEFNSGVKVHDLKEADQEPKPPSNHYYPFYGLSDDNKPVALLPPFSADKENIEKARVIVSRLNASGGTNIASALNVAINLVRKGVMRDQAPGETGPTAPTGETQPTGETAETQTAGPYPPATTTQAPPTDVDDGEEKQELESIIVFLTDGEPTVGETDPNRIINRVTEKNSGQRRATIFSLAFGEDADRAFLRKLSLRNAGFARHIYEAADAALQLRDFYRQISSPLLDDVTFVYPPDQVKDNSLTKHKFRTYYEGSEVVVAGQLQPAAQELTPQVRAFCGVEDGIGKNRYEVFPRVPVARASSPGALERLWVYLTIKQLLDQKDAADGAAPAGEDPEKKAKELALQYSLVTPLTSLVVVKPNATSAVDTQSVDEPNRPFYGGLLAAQSFNSYPSSMAFGSFAVDQTISNPLLVAPLLEADFQEESLAYDYSDVPLRTAAFSSAAQIIRVNRPHYSFMLNSGKTVAPGGAAYSPGLIGLSSRPASGPGQSGQPGQPGQLGQPGQPGQPVQPVQPSRPAQFGQGGSVGSGGPVLNQPLQPPSTTPPRPTTNQGTTGSAAPTAANTLQEYHLENYGWAKNLLDANSDQLVLRINGTSRINLKLTKDNEAPKDASDAACTRSTDGGAGVCVYLTRCDSAKNITEQNYLDIYCSVDTSNQGYAGVCCPSAQVDRPQPAP